MPNTSVYISSAASITPMGDAAETYAKLLRNEKSLELSPVFGTDGDPVPLSIFESINASLPPAWLTQLEPLVERLPHQQWGKRNYPIVITSSNFGIGHMLAAFIDQNDAHLHYAQAHTSIDAICEYFHWEKNVTILSHACVSADIGIKYASKLLHHSEAKEVLVFSFDFLSPFVTGGFYSLKILNNLFPAPYADQAVGSIGLGDGAAFAVLTREPRRFSIKHQHTYNEMFTMTGNRPDGSGFKHVLESIHRCLGGEKVWVKGHGTGTLTAGKLEAESVASVFSKAPLVSWKGGIGHTLGSCGLVELSLAMEAIKNNKAPGTVGTEGSTINDNVRKEGFSLSEYDGVIMSSNAFGGAHASYFLSQDQSFGSY